MQLIIFIFLGVQASPSGKSSPERDENMADLVTSQKPLASETETVSELLE